MKKPIALLMIMMIAVVALHSCDQKQKHLDTSQNITPKKEKTITVYGSQSCDHCLEFRKKADELKIKYSFKDCEADERNYNELAFKIQQGNYPGYISFPVIDIDGKLYINPGFEQFLQLIDMQVN